MATVSAQTLLVGRAHGRHGLLHVETVDDVTAAAISAGSDHASPSLVFKGDASVPNEDAATVVCDHATGARAFAVADAHFGASSSETIITHLHTRWSTRLPMSAAELASDISSTARPGTRFGTRPRDRSETTLVAAVMTRRGRVFGLSWGDSSCVAIVHDATSAARCNRRDDRYVSPLRPRTLADANPFELQLDRGEMLVLFTDGVDECHYREPETSVQLHHVAAAARAASDAADAARRIGELALAGVDGHPGGQDNLAIVVAQH